MKSQIRDLIDQLKSVQNGKLWMGRTFDRLLNQVNEETAFVRPLPDMHSVAELISHLTFWREECLLKIRTGQGSKTDDSPENWLPNKILRQAGWATLKAEHDRTLAELLSLLEARNDVFLDEIYYDTDYKGEYPYRFLIHGMLHHDLYHLGQLGLIMKYLRKGRG